MAKGPEYLVKQKVVKTLKEFGAYYFYPVTGGYGASGVPDIVVCYKGRFIGIECKADARKRGPTPLQTKNLTQIRQTGGVAMVIDKNNIEDVRGALETIGANNHD